MLEDPPPWWTPDFDPPYSAQWQAQARTWISALQSQSREDLIAAQRAEAPDWPEVDLAPWAESELRFNLKFFNHLGPVHIDWSALVGGIRCPVLLITGDPERGALVTPEHARALHAWLPQLHYRAHSRSRAQHSPRSIRGFPAGGATLLSASLCIRIILSGEE